jgi:hypothetical protein
MKNLYYGFIVLLCALTNFSATAQISGTVFKDFNNNGLYENTATTFPFEKGLPAATVNVYNATNVLVGTTTTTATGTYTIAVAAGSYRVEFVSNSGSFNGSSSSSTAGSSNSDIQFVTAPIANVNYGAASSDWYAISANPFFATNLASAGAANGGANANRTNLMVMPYSMPQTGTTGQFDAAQTQVETNASLGSIFGLAYQKSTNTLVMSAYYKRHVGFGTGGIGAIYKSQVTSGNPAVPTLLVNVSNIGINVGADTRVTTPTSDPNYLPVNNGVGVTSIDRDAFANIAKRGIGDIDISDNSKDLFLINLFDNRLYKINIGAPIKPAASITSADVTSWATPNPATGSLVWHPFALKVHNSKVYVGGVIVNEKITNHNLATDTVGQRGIVYEFIPTTGVFTEVLRFPLSYRRGYSNNDFRFPTKNNYWCAWQNNGDGSATGPLQAGYNTAAGTFNGGIYYPQPMLADIEFSDDNQMLIGMRDRFGDQMGYQQPDINGFPGATGFTVANQQFRGLNSGDNLVAGKNTTGSGWTLETNGQVTNYGITTGTAGGRWPVGTPIFTNTASWSGATGSPMSITDGTANTSGKMGPGSGFGTSVYTPPGGPAPGNNTGGYYLANQNNSADAADVGETGLNNTITLNGAATAINAHILKGDGGLGVLHGSNELIFSAMDPVNNAFTSGVIRTVINTNGNALHGNMVQRIEVVPFATNDPSNNGKANAIGDIELLTEFIPIEIGNRVFRDANNNGVQDAGAAEAGINAVTVELVSPGLDGIFGNADDVVVATTTTATIAGQQGSYYFNTLTTADTRAAGANLPGVPALRILPGFPYQVRIPNTSGGSQQAALAGLQLTNADVSANTFNNIDSDGATSGTAAIALVNTDNNDHSFDFGFKSLASIGDRVYLDNGAGANAANGIQDAGEPGVAGITVTLYQNGANGIPGDADDIVLGTTVTDAYGNYLFNNLTPSTSAATSYNVGFTLPANYQFTTQTNTQVTGTSNATNTTTITGGSTAANGSDANATTGRTGSFWLTDGEAETGVDAGLIFNTPALLSSIGDRVWLDNGGGANAGNGNQDAGEPGVAGVTVTLYKETALNSGVFLPYLTTTTDVNGNYLFTELPNNLNYRVGITPPTGTLLTTSVGGTTAGNATLNSDLDPTTRLSANINIPVGGAQITGIDAGLITQPNNKASIGDRVWHDVNRNGVQDAGEPGIAGVTVQLFNSSNTLIATTTTDAFGNYIFTDLNPGDYSIGFGVIAGMQRTSINATTGNIPDATDSDANVTTGRTGLYTLVAGEENMSVDAGYFSTQPAANVGALGDKVFNDLNGDGVQDANEPGVAGITVTLFDNAGVAIATTTTDTNGNYLFAGLTPGNYSVGFSNLPIGFAFTQQDKGGNDANDSDVNPATGRTASVAVTGGTTTTNVDAGIRQGIPSGRGSLGNRVWVDLNNNGLQDADETGVAGVTVQLFTDSNNDGVISGAELTATATTTTNALGEYLFTGLNAGTYQVGFSTLPAAYTLATKDVATNTNDNLDSDGNPLNTTVAGNTATAGKTYTDLVRLAQGEDNLSVDLGLVQPASRNTLGNFVWFDTNNDGLQTAGEVGVAGVTVTLVNASGQFIDITGAITTTPVTTTTNADGQYLFTGLSDGTYGVKFTNLPAGFDYTTKSATNDLTGSDADRVSGITPTVTLTFATGGTSRDNRSLDAGLVSTRSALGNFVWSDLNNNGTQEAGEPGIAGVTVTLFRPGFGLDGIAGNADDALPVTSMITDANGAYLFSNLVPGDYQLEFTTIPTGMSFTQQNTPGDNQNNTNSDANPSNTNGRTGSISLTAGEVDLTVDAGLTVVRPATISNKVFADLDFDGIQDTNEPGIGGVFVTLYNSSNQPIGSAVTNGDGTWKITNVPTGTGYYVIFTPNLPSFDVSGSPGTNPAWTLQNQGANGTASIDSGTESDTDSDVNPTGVNAGRAGIFSIVPGNNFPNIDAGIINWPAGNLLPISLANFIAQPKNNTVDLNWVFATEINVQQYEIEFSTNGTRFDKIGNTNAIGASNYNYIHIDPIKGLNYYRIKVIYNNGKVAYSEIRIVKFGGADVSINLYPVPTASNLNITVSQAMINEAAVISIYSVDGKLMFKQNFNTLSQTETINLSKFSNGKYVVNISTKNENINKQIEVLR